MAKFARRFRAVVALALSYGSWARSETVSRLCDFEGPEDLRAWEISSGTPVVGTEGATHGRRALRIDFDPAGHYHPAYLQWRRVPRDWSAFDALVLEVTNPTGEPIPGYVLVADHAWEAHGRSYWNRHNGGRTFAPGHSSWVIPVQGLYRGEAGSRNNDLKRNIDPDQIVRVDFGFGRKGSSGQVIVDDLRLVKADRPANARAFDFGPPSQSIMPGWTPVSQASRYSREQGFGWGPPGGTPWNGAARDTTFGPALTRDFCEAGGYTFRVNLPEGRYRVAVIYENSGYWGGEQAKHQWRRILVNGAECHREERPDGAAHALYRFETLEPLGIDLWDAYMAPELARRTEFEAAAAEGRLEFRFEADRVWGSKVAALAIVAESDEAGRQWLTGQWHALAAEFREQAVSLDAPAAATAPVPQWQAHGLCAWPVSLDDDVQPHSTPPAGSPGPAALQLERLAVGGECEPFCLAVRPLRPLGRCAVRLEALSRQGLELPATVAAVWYNTSRGFNTLAYRIMPHTLRPAKTVDLGEGVTRELIVTVRVAGDTPAGEYQGALVLAPAGGQPALRVPLRLNVAPVALDRDSDFLMGFFGLMPPGLMPEARRWEVLEQTLAMLRAHGMNAVSGGPNWTLTGWRDGQPQIDFGDTDRFFNLLRRYGFTRAINGYGGLRFNGLHDGYQKGEQGAKVEQQSGLPYAEALLRAWRAVDAHARQRGWPTIFYAMCDETRVRAVAERELAFMRMMAAVSQAFPATLQTSGSYSVSFGKHPTDPEDLLYWHQRFFETLDISSLNGHDPTVMEMAGRLGKEIHVYNQGRTRYSFGLYQWSERRKGVGARWQWHLNVLHGYQFFDLDGREPDTAMMCYGRDSIYPTIHFERCREGAEDFYLYHTLWQKLRRLGRRGGGGPAAKAAAALLKRLETSVSLNQRQPPAAYHAEVIKRDVVAALRALAGN